MWEAFEVEFPGDKLAQLHAGFARGPAMLNADGRGCDMANAAAELTEPDHPARLVIKELKEAQRHRLVTLCRDAGHRPGPNCSPIRYRFLSRAARVSVQNVGNRRAQHAVRAMAEGLITSFRAR